MSAYGELSTPILDLAQDLARGIRLLERDGGRSPWVLRVHLQVLDLFVTAIKFFPRYRFEFLPAPSLEPSDYVMTTKSRPPRPQPTHYLGHVIVP